MNGVRLLLEAYRKRCRLRLVRQICRQHRFDLPWRVDDDDVRVFLDIFCRKEYAPCFPLYRNATIVDIGGHKGMFALYAALYSGEGTVIHSFEPEPGNFETLLKTVSVNGLSKVIPRKVGISGTGGRRSLYLSKSINHSLVELVTNHPLISQYGTVEVETITLGDFCAGQSLHTIDFLKIDCEGAEYEILDAAAPELFSRVTTIAVEFHDMRKRGETPDSLVTLFLRNGYSIVTLRFQDTPLPLHTGILVVTRG